MGDDIAVLAVERYRDEVRAGTFPGKLRHRSNMTNRLADRHSPYLLQHAENPVDWYSWGPEALDRAVEEGEAHLPLDRLLRIAIGAT